MLHLVVRKQHFIIFSKLSYKNILDCDEQKEEYFSI